MVGGPLGVGEGGPQTMQQPRRRGLASFGHLAACGRLPLLLAACARLPLLPAACGRLPRILPVPACGPHTIASTLGAIRPLDATCPCESTVCINPLAVLVNDVARGVDA